MIVFRLFGSRAAIAARRLAICSVCCFPGGCAWMDDFVFSDFRTDLGSGLASIAETAKGVKEVGKAAATAGGSLVQLKESMDSLDELPTRLRKELGSLRALDALAARLQPTGAPAAVVPGSSAAPPDGATVTCGSAAEDEVSAIRGEFTGAGKRSRLFLTRDCRIGHEDGPEAELPDAPDAASFEAICRDPVSGRDHAVVRTAAGPSSPAVQIWGVDPGSSAPTPFYTESWEDTESGDRGEQGLDDLIARGWTCLWRRRQAARATP